MINMTKAAFHKWDPDFIVDIICVGQPRMSTLMLDIVEGLPPKRYEVYGDPTTGVILVRTKHDRPPLEVV